MSLERVMRQEGRSNKELKEKGLQYGVVRIRSK